MIVAELISRGVRWTKMKCCDWPLLYADVHYKPRKSVQERANQTHELVMLDYYSFVVEAHKGAFSSREMLAPRVGGGGGGFKSGSGTYEP